MYRRALVAAGVAACGPRGQHVTAPVAADPPIAFVVAERTDQGARLVGLDSGGDRQYALVELADPSGTVLARETHPVVSPDGKWIAFVSSRDRAPDETSVWVAPLAAEAVAVRIDAVAAIEAHPTWTPDGRALVFASTVDGPDFDLWRIPIAAGRAVGPAVQLTHGDGHEITPSVAADGTIAYSAVTLGADGPPQSHLELLAPDGTITQLTTGPADVSPAFSPDGVLVAFARPVEHASATGPASIDSDLFTMPRAGGDATAVVAVPLTDESGPVWSRDGRFVLATSVLRGETSNVLFSSVIHVDLREHPRRARILRDRVRAYLRLTPAVVGGALDVAALHGDPEYLPELQRIMAAAIAEQVEAAP